MVVSSGISLPILHSRTEKGWRCCLCCSHSSGAIPFKCFLYVTLGVPPHDLHSPPMVLGCPHLILRPVDLKLLKPKTSGVYICCPCVWRLHVAIKRKDTKKHFMSVNKKKINPERGIRKSRRKGLPCRKVVQGRFHWERKSRWKTSEDKKASGPEKRCSRHVNMVPRTWCGNSASFVQERARRPVYLQQNELGGK